MSGNEASGALGDGMRTTEEKKLARQAITQAICAVIGIFAMYAAGFLLILWGAA